MHFGQRRPTSTNPILSICIRSISIAPTLLHNPPSQDLSSKSHCFWIDSVHATPSLLRPNVARPCLHFAERNWAITKLHFAIAEHRTSMPMPDRAALDHRSTLLLITLPQQDSAELCQSVTFTAPFLALPAQFVTLLYSTTARRSTITCIAFTIRYTSLPSRHLACCRPYIAIIALAAQRLSLPMPYTAILRAAMPKHLFSLPKRAIALRCGALLCHGNTKLHTTQP